MSAILKKVVIIGAGYVGSSIAYALTIRSLPCEIVLVDIDGVKAAGEAADIQHGIPYMGVSSVRTGDYSDCADCDLIIITAGRNRHAGETRLNLIGYNSTIMRSVVDQIKPHYNGAVILIVSNPIDIMVELCTRLMCLPDGKVFGTGCILDTSRMMHLISAEYNVNINRIKGAIVGEHGDSQLPIWSGFTVDELPIAEYCQKNELVWNEERREYFASKVRDMGAQIIGAKGKTHYGIATCVCAISNAILNDSPFTAPVSSSLKGEYGVSGISLSVPSVISRNGVQERLVENWNDSEFASFKKCAEKLKNTFDQCNLI